MTIVIRGKRCSSLQSHGVKKMPRLSKTDAVALVDVIDKYGDILITIGKIEKRAGSLKSWADRISKMSVGEIVSKFEKNPKIAAKFGAVLTKFMTISTEKKISELSPAEKIGAGKIYKEMSGLLREVLKRV